ncbi:hypothetical protein NG2371_06385 [Nocardia gamkensis]|nr:hypothetical protein [Nocardia gamkensis]
MKFRNPFKSGQAGDRDRLIRLFAIFISTGYLIYFLLLYPRLATEASHLADWWMPLGLTAVYGPPLVLCATAFLTELPTLEKTAGAVAICYFVAAFTWPLAWQGELFGEWPFIANIPGLAAMAAALTWRPSWVIIYTFAVVAEVQVLGQTRAPDVIEPFWMSWVFATSFCLAYVAAALRAVRTGHILDTARDEAARLSAEAAAVLAYNDDREKFANVVHDNVMHCLRIGIAGKSSPKDADEALRALDEIGTTSGDEPFSGKEAIAYLQEKLEAIDESVPLTIESSLDGSDFSFDAAVVRTAGIVLREAVKNSVRHAGPDAQQRVTLHIGPGLLGLIVADDGRGFDPSRPSRRWGLRRLPRQVERVGGELRIDSRKGHGTTIEMLWVDQ